MIPFFFKKNKNSTCFFVRKHTNKGVLLVRAMRRLMAKMSFVEKQIKGGHGSKLFAFKGSNRCMQFG